MNFRKKSIFQASAEYSMNNTARSKTPIKKHPSLVKNRSKESQQIDRYLNLNQASTANNSPAGSIETKEYLVKSQKIKATSVLRISDLLNINNGSYQTSQEKSSPSTGGSKKLMKKIKALNSFKNKACTQEYEPSPIKIQKHQLGPESLYNMMDHEPLHNNMIESTLFGRPIITVEEDEDLEQAIIEAMKKTPTPMVYKKQSPQKKVSSQLQIPSLLPLKTIISESEGGFDNLHLKVESPQLRRNISRGSKRHRDVDELLQDFSSSESSFSQDQESQGGDSVDSSQWFEMMNADKGNKLDTMDTYIGIGKQSKRIASFSLKVQKTGAQIRQEEYNLQKINKNVNLIMSGHRPKLVDQAAISQLKEFKLRAEVEFDKYIVKNTSQFLKAPLVADINNRKIIRLIEKTPVGGFNNAHQIEINGGNSDRYYFRKSIILERCSDEEYDSILKAAFQEFTTAKYFDHPNLIKYLYFQKHDESDSQTRDVHIYTKWPEGFTMSKKINHTGQLYYLVDYVKETGLQLITAIKYLHDRCIVNANINTDNIVFNTDGTIIKLMDLGLSNYFLTEDSIGSNIDMKRKPTNLRYTSPEQILDGIASFKSDIWSFGCVLLQLCTGKEPYDDQFDQEKLGIMIAQDKVTPLEHMLKTHKSESMIIRDNKPLKKLLKVCFLYNIEKRPSSTEVYHLDFFQNYIKSKYEGSQNPKKSFKVRKYAK